MRILPVLSGLVALAALAVALHPGQGLEAFMGVRADGGYIPIWALFTFAVSAFRGPLR